MKASAIIATNMIKNTLTNNPILSLPPRGGLLQQLIEKLHLENIFNRESIEPLS